MAAADSDLVLSLGDDSYPEQMDCLTKLTDLFEAYHRLAVVIFPQRTDEYPETLTQSEFRTERVSGSFANSGAVLRRSIYLELSGFESRFFHMHEELDYALQCAAAGYRVLFTRVITIRHHYSGQVRSEMRNHHRHARDELWSTLLRCPFPFAIGMAVWRVFPSFGMHASAGGHG